jgi:hypothetical protein
MKLLNACSRRAALRRERLENSSARPKPPGIRKITFVVLYLKRNDTKVVTVEIIRIWKEEAMVYHSICLERLRENAGFVEHDNRTPKERGRNSTRKINYRISTRKLIISVKYN